MEKIRPTEERSSTFLLHQRHFAECTATYNFDKIEVRLKYIMNIVLFSAGSINK